MWDKIILQNLSQGSFRGSVKLFVLQMGEMSANIREIRIVIMNAIQIDKGQQEQRYYSS